MKRQIEVAVVGSRAAGAAQLAEYLAARATHYTGKEQVLLHYDMHPTHEDMDAENHDVVLQLVDAMDLEQSLMQIPSLVEHAHHMVVGIVRYEQLLATGHRLDCHRMEELIGVPVVLLTAEDDADRLPALLCEVAMRARSQARPVVHGWEQQDEQAYRAYVQGVLHETLQHPKRDTAPWQERLTRLMTKPLTGFPILAIILCVVFWATFAIGNPLQDLLQTGVDALHDWLASVLPASWWESLLADGIVQGVGSLLTALPNIIVLFFFLSVMEDTGYMARVAYLMDGVMHSVGLHGRSFIPMLMGFDCNVPAIMAAKDIRYPQDRVLTMLMIPFMSCSARLPVYILLIGMFFPHHQALVLGSIYLLGIVLSFLFAFLMKRTRWFRGESDVLINELPDLHMPKADSIGRHIWYRVSDFLKKISTVVLVASVVIWFLQYFPAHDLEHIESSWLAAVGKFIEPVMRPLGFDWKLSVCLLTGVPAKETIGATFAILFGNDLSLTALTPVTAYALLVFILLYFPCVATISTLRRETNWKWATFSVVNSLMVAWLMAYVVHTVGNFLF